MIKFTIGTTPQKVLKVQNCSAFNAVFSTKGAFGHFVLRNVKLLVTKSGISSRFANRRLLLTCGSGFKITFKEKNRSASPVNQNKSNVICLTLPVKAENNQKYVNLFTFSSGPLSRQGN